jgi:L-alanine-DL-glutamate epimerase-like enolase superfamily enzyme
VEFFACFREENPGGRGGAGGRPPCLPPMVVVTHIEVHHVECEHHEWLQYVLGHYHERSDRTIYVAHTDSGLIGLGESSGLGEAAEVVQRYVGTSPWLWLGDRTSLGLGTAMYDLMGQDAGVPVWQLFGQQVRRWVPVGAWTVSSSPAHMAEAVERYAAQGYTWMKYHLSPFHNVITQLEAIQAVAPPDFRIHLDFTMEPLEAHVQLCDLLAERFPCVGCFEDSFMPRDLQKWKEFKLRAKRPVVMHHPAMGFTTEVSMGLADIYMMGHAPIGDVAEKAGHFAGAGAPFMLQNMGGAITRAMVVHMMSAFSTASFKCHNDTETFRWDVVDSSSRQQLEPVNGFVRVPDGPGLGLRLDRAELERLANHPRKQNFPPFIIRTKFASGAMMYNPSLRPDDDDGGSGAHLVMPTA